MTVDQKTETAGQKLFKELARQRVLVWDREPDIREKAMAMGEHYRRFLDAAKTEREGVEYCLAWAAERGFKPLADLASADLVPGCRFLVEIRNKALVLGVLGSEPLERGFNLVGAHLDAPRLDLKPLPLYEAEGLALLKTHYYGGIKKYQWTSIPLALHGVVVKGNGERVKVIIGEDPADPVLAITDLLPHLAKDQMQKKMQEAVAGEDLNIVAGSMPHPDQEVKERVKLAVLEWLYQRYGLVEEDFTSAELEAVPAGPARDVGLDRSLVGGYGQDDRVCCFTALAALGDLTGVPRRTALVLLVDKEEIGSMGSTGMESRLLIHLLEEILTAQGVPPYPAASRALANARALSADVNAAIDPTFEGVMEKNNAARLGHGVVVTKYTGAGGKYNASDAHAELVGEVRRLFNQHGIVWQVGELGKVDQGGGGTIARYLANLGMDVVDCGVPLLSMHAPMELASKADIYMTYRAFLVFLSS